MRAIIGLFVLLRSLVLWSLKIGGVVKNVMWESMQDPACSTCSTAVWWAEGGPESGLVTSHNSLQISFSVFVLLTGGQE